MARFLILNGLFSNITNLKCIMKNFICSFILLFLFVAGIRAGDLSRRGALGVQLVAVSDSLAGAHQLEQAVGVAVHLVVEGGAGHLMGLERGDIILAINEEPVSDVINMVNRIGRFQEADIISLNLLRNGKPLFLSGALKGFPRETSAYAEVIYDAVPFGDGWLRTIIHKPMATGKLPAVFLIQGADCGSIDNLPAHSPYTRLVEGFSKEGFVVIKTEKQNVGDSRNACSCQETGLFGEVAGFAASFNALVKYDFIDHDNVFVFGFSMGGVQAPLMQTALVPKGIAVFGTVARPWFEYLIEITRWQRLIRGQDFVMNDANQERFIRFFFRFMIDKQTPEQLLKDPEMAQILRSFWTYDESGLMTGRSHIFWQQLQDARVMEAWSRTQSHVLSLWGEGDYVAMNPKEHELIADIVNHYHPGKARFVRIPNTDHSLLYVRDQRHSSEVVNDYEYHRDNFNPAIVEITKSWMRDLMKN